MADTMTMTNATRMDATQPVQHDVLGAYGIEAMVGALAGVEALVGEELHLHRRGVHPVLVEHVLHLVHERPKTSPVRHSNHRLLNLFRLHQLGYLRHVASRTNTRVRVSGERQPFLPRRRRATDPIHAARQGWQTGWKQHAQSDKNGIDGYEIGPRSRPHPCKQNIHHAQTRVHETCTLSSKRLLLANSSGTVPYRIMPVMKSDVAGSA
eukprot:1193966-Prorocentrum_minimum.AAC.1